MKWGWCVEALGAVQVLRNHLGGRGGLGNDYGWLRGGRGGRGDDYVITRGNFQSKNKGFQHE